MYLTFLGETSVHLSAVYTRGIVIGTWGDWKRSAIDCPICPRSREEKVDLNLNDIGSG
jgi:hypothetical protein